MQTRVCVVGGGMVGATLALALAREGITVSLVEAREPDSDWSPASYDLRVSAITRASRQIFSNLDAWSGMAARRVTPYRRMHVWDAGGSGEIEFDSADLGEAELGHIIENRVIQLALWEQLAQAESLQLICPAAIASLDLEGVRPSLQFADGRQLQSELVVAADGANSFIRNQADIPVEGWPYEQQAVVATVRAAQGHGDTAWQRFLPNGPLALLPIGKDCFSLVWSTSPAQAEELLTLADSEFADAVESAAEGRVGELSAVGPRAAFPLRLQHAQCYVKPGLALVGDAAHVIHPLAGQGVNLGLLDAAALAEVLLGAARRGRPLGDMHVLRRYERARKGDNLAMQYAMDGFKRLFGSQAAPVRTLRSFGLGLVDRAGPLKQLFAGSAMGTVLGELPVLARPGSRTDDPA